jgi:small subunit ribosomal protein S16
MIAIRLTRFGRKKAPFYRIVATDSTKKQGGVVLQVLGTWNPAMKELKVKEEELKAWVGKGAQISPAVKKLINSK